MSWDPQINSGIRVTCRPYVIQRQFPIKTKHLYLYFVFVFILKEIKKTWGLSNH